jgi:hypothetical protein
MANREPPVINAYQTRRILLALVGAVILFGIAGLFTFRFLKRRAAVVTAVPANGTVKAPAAPEPTAPTASPFTELTEASIPGRYKYTDRGQEFFMVLYDDHTFMNRDGTIFPQYRWDIEPDDFAIRWQNSVSRFNTIERPGVFTVTKGNGQVLRMEKLPPYEPSQLIPPKPVASVSFGRTWQTNGLVPVIGRGEELRRGQIGGSQCLQVARAANRWQCMLYLQIVPELKDPLFTNALLIVEFFDRAPLDGRADQLALQYDAEHATNANTQPLPLTGSESWQEATFFIPRPVFENRQENGADLHLGVAQRDLFIRSVKLVKNTILPEKKMPMSAPVSTAP